MKEARHREAANADGGSALLVILMGVMVVAVVLQTAFAVLLCAERAVQAESDGRTILAAKDDVLADLAAKAAISWRPGLASNVERGKTSAHGSVSGLSPASDWGLGATASEVNGTSATVSASLEKGRDGIDLPFAALVAAEVIAANGRTSEWISLEHADVAEPVDSSLSGSEEVGCYLLQSPSGAILGRGCVQRALRQKWRLDEGWTTLGTDSQGARVGYAGTVSVIHQDAGVVTPTATSLGQDAASPCLIVVAGGAKLDARHLGDLYGVIVVGDSSLQLEGTVVHGAVFTTGTVELGESGTIKFDRKILRWATDNSLRRVRLVPGTRREGG